MTVYSFSYLEYADNKVHPDLSTDRVQSMHTCAMPRTAITILPNGDALTNCACGRSAFEYANGRAYASVAIANTHALLAINSD